MWERVIQRLREVVIRMGESIKHKYNWLKRRPTLREQDRSKQRKRRGKPIKTMKRRGNERSLNSRYDPLGTEVESEEEAGVDMEKSDRWELKQEEKRRGMHKLLLALEDRVSEKKMTLKCIKIKMSLALRRSPTKVVNQQ